MVKKNAEWEKKIGPFHSITNVCISSHIFLHQYMPLRSSVAAKFYMKDPTLKINKNIRLHDIRLSSCWHLRYTDIKSGP